MATTRCATTCAGARAAEGGRLDVRDGACATPRASRCTANYLDSTESARRRRPAAWSAHWRSWASKLTSAGRLRALPAAAEKFDVRDRRISFPARTSRAGLRGPLRQQGGGHRGSGNFAGIKNPAIDAVMASSRRRQARDSCRPAARWSASSPRPLPDPAWTSRHHAHRLQRWRWSGPRSSRPIRRKACRTWTGFTSTWWARMPPRHRNRRACFPTSSNACS
jgi:microcin C transport system substrate-binding protein